MGMNYFDFFKVFALFNQCRECIFESEVFRFSKHFDIKDCNHNNKNASNQSKVSLALTCNLRKKKRKRKKTEPGMD